MPMALHCQYIYSDFNIAEEVVMKLSNKVELLFEDEHILVCKKPQGLATQTQSSRSPDMVSVLKRYLYSKNPSLGEPYLAIVHRLDQPVSGILVFGKSPAAAKELTWQLQHHKFGKHYAALLTASPELPEGTWEHYMIKDSATNTSSICTKDTPGAKRGCLHYKVINNPTTQDTQVFAHITEDISALCFVEISLETGRHHQIRVQTSTMGCSIMGDTKYGRSDSSDTWQHIALCAYKLSFSHPFTKKYMEFKI